MNLNYTYVFTASFYMGKFICIFSYFLVKLKSLEIYQFKVILQIILPPPPHISYTLRYKNKKKINFDFINATLKILLHFTIITSLKLDVVQIPISVIL